MRTIKDLTVRVIYRVGIGNIQVPENVYNELNQIAESGIGEVDGMGTECTDAVEWLRDNIQERDCCDINYAIEELS
jgi:hypothetical protein